MSLWKDFNRTINDLSEVHYLSIPTWLALGAALQLLALTLPFPRLSGVLPVVYLAYRLIKAVVGSRNVFIGSYKTVKRGRWTAEFPKRGDTDDRQEGIVMHVIGARMNHPFGPLAPGNDDISKDFQAMWDEAELNREKWGFLGTTGMLRDSEDSEGTTMTWLSYWKNVEGLHAFATSAAHRHGENKYNKKKYPYMGVMHETYYASNGNWETVYDNMPPWGFAQIAEKTNSLYPVSAGNGNSNASRRMRRNAAIDSL